MARTRSYGVYQNLSTSMDWHTPPELFDQLDREFGPFDLDPCGSKEHHYSAHKIYQRGGLFFDGTCPELDGLTNSWAIPGVGPSTVFMNPPYGREIVFWIEWALEQLRANASRLVLGLLPVRADAKWWQENIAREFDLRTGDGRWNANLALLRFLPGRVRYANGVGPARFANAVVVWEQRDAEGEWLG